MSALYVAIHCLVHVSLRYIEQNVSPQQRACNACVREYVISANASLGASRNDFSDIDDSIWQAAIVVLIVIKLAEFSLAARSNRARSLKEGKSRASSRRKKPNHGIKIVRSIVKRKKKET
jgi:hypothetical protein